MKKFDEDGLMEMEKIKNKEDEKACSVDAFRVVCNKEGSKSTNA